MCVRKLRAFFCRPAPLFAVFLVAYVGGLLVFITKLPGSRLDRSEQWVMEREYAARADNCPHPSVAEWTSAEHVVGTCSARADSMGPHQNVVSFTYFGELKPWRSYLKGIDANARLVALYYPGWRMRVYHSVERGSRWWKPLVGASCWYSHVDLCPVPAAGAMPMLWRVLPAKDPMVDLFVSRDLDSRVSEREAAAMMEWLRSNLTFHVMRDYPGHLSPLMGGLWGARVHQLRTELHRAVDGMLNMWNRPGATTRAPQSTAPRGRSPNDQDVLAQWVWPLARDRILQHDAYSCNSTEFLEHGGLRPFPTPRVHWSASNFVGALYNDPPLRDPCPEQCRPPAHPEWTTC